MTKKLSWRLSKLPTPSELTDLVNNKIITQDEAREILFQEVDERNAESLKEEIKFLRTLVDTLSKNKTTIVETIREVARPWYGWAWYQPYAVWCGSAATTTSGSTGITYAGTMGNSGTAGGGGGSGITTSAMNTSSSLTYAVEKQPKLSEVKTF